jgi:hypothetical protein
MRKEDLVSDESQFAPFAVSTADAPSADAADWTDDLLDALHELELVEAASRGQGRGQGRDECDQADEPTLAELLRLHADAAALAGDAFGAWLAARLDAMAEFAEANQCRSPAEYDQAEAWWAEQRYGR